MNRAYQIDTGEIWLTSKAAFVSEGDPALAAWLAQDKADGGDGRIKVTNAGTPGGRGELAEILRFYGYPLGEMQGAPECIAAIDARLRELDLESVRPLRAIADGSATEADRAKLAALATEAETLRAERAALTITITAEQTGE